MKSTNQGIRTVIYPVEGSLVDINSVERAYLPQRLDEMKRE